jgi:hypothetical protein
MAPSVEFAWVEAFWNVESIEQKSDDIGDDTQSEGCYRNQRLCTDTRSRDED